MAKGLLFYVLMFFLSIAWASNADEVDRLRQQGDYFAIIDGEVISRDIFSSYLRAGMKQRFYHGNPPQSEVLEYQKEMADQLIEEFLVLREAKQRGISPDEALVSDEIAKIDERYRNDEQWLARRDELMPEIKKDIEARVMRQKLEVLVKDIGDLPTETIKKFYQENRELFTTPQKDHVKMILLKVDPSSSGDIWRAAEDRAAKIVDDLRKGGDFSELAMIHSGDESASNGGDMGYLHKGMLGDAAQQVLDLMAPGDISEPVLLLEGVAVFQLYARAEPEVNDFEVVKERVAVLLKRKLADEAWSNMLSRLRGSAQIEVNEALLSGS